MREAHALAQLSHPNVVAIYDVETGDRGVVIVMELVRGVTLSEWLDAQPRSTDEILRRFLEAARGLEAAHRAGLIHRDFKPANVLISEEGVARVLDFGLARGEDHGSIGSMSDVEPTAHDESHSVGPFDELTDQGLVVGTVAYMAPEQHLGHRADARVDQYAFCIALWQALAKRHPFSDANDLRTMVKAKLSGQLSWPRGVAIPRRLLQALRRGLATDRDERWSSMEPLIRTLERTLGRSQRQRTAGLVALGSVISGVGVWFGGPGSATTAPTCIDGRTRLGSVWDGAARSKVHAAFETSKVRFAEDTWVHLSERLDAYANRWASTYAEICEASTVRREVSSEVADLRMSCLATARNELRVTVDLLSAPDANLIRRVPHLLDDLPSLGRCQGLEALEDQVPLPSDPNQAAAVKRARPLLARARKLYAVAEYDATLRKLDDVDAVLSEIDFEPVIAEATLVRARVYSAQGRDEEAASLLRSTVRKAVDGKFSGTSRQALFSLAKILAVRLDQFDEGRFLAELGVDLAQGHGSRELADAHHALATVLHKTADYAAAEDHYRTAMAELERAGGRNDADYAAMWTNLASVTREQGRFAEAEREHRAALALKLEVLGPEHPDIAASYNNLASVRRQSGDLPGAREALRHAIEIAEAALGPTHPDLALYRSHLAGVLKDEGHSAAAEREYQAAIEIEQRASGEDHPAVTHSMSGLAQLFRESGRYQEAESIQRELVAMLEKRRGPDHPATAMERANLANTLLGRERYEEAEGLYREVLTAMLDVYGPRHESVAQVHGLMGVALQHQGRLEEAEAQQRQALEIVLEAFGPHHTSVAGVRNNLARVLLLREDYDEAQLQFEQAVDVLQEHFPPSHPDLLGTRLGLAELWVARGRLAKGESEFRALLELARERSETNPVELAYVLRGLADALEVQGKRAAEVRRLRAEAREIAGHLE